MNTHQLTLLICGFFLIVCTTSSQSNPLTHGTITFANDNKLVVEIADTPALRATGLMYRDHLEENMGMLFVYPDQANRGVWMKNTLLALDVIFLSDSGKIISILTNLLPCKQDPCPIFTSIKDARYMLEVNTGFIEKHQIEVGQDVTLDYHLMHSK